MAEIKNIRQDTDNPFLNMYTLQTINKKGKPGHYYVASRARSVGQLKLKTRKNKPDGVVIYSLYGEKADQVVLIRQYRYALDDYIYEFPAGLVEDGEDYHQAAIREMKEETGLELELLPADPSYEKPFFTTIGMTDESCATVYGISRGTVSREGQEDSEEIEVVFADRAEAKRILQEENVAIICAYMLMHFIHDEEPLDFLKKKKGL